MKRLILIPLLFTGVLGFSQRIDTLMGYKGKLKIDTAITIDGNYLFTPSQNHISFDSTKIPWRPNGSKIYYNNGFVGIGTSEPRARLFIEDSTIGLNQTGDSSGIALVNDATPGNASSSATGSPSLLFSSKGQNSVAVALQPVKFRLSSMGSTGNPTPAFFNLEASVNNGAYLNIFKINQAGTASFNGGITASGASYFGTSVNVGSGYFQGYNLTLVGYGQGDFLYFGNNTVSGTANAINIKPTISSGPRLTGVLFNPNMTTGDTAIGKITAFQNVIGDNKFNTSTGRSGFGVADADSVNGSAKVEIKDSTKGFLPPRMTKAQRDAIISYVKGSITAAGTGYGNNMYASIPLAGGSGTGAIASIKTAISVVGITIRVTGSGYKVGDVLTAPSLPGGSGFTYTISAVGLPATGLEIWQTDNTPGPRWFDGTNWVKTTLTAD